MWTLSDDHRGILAKAGKSLGKHQVSDFSGQVSTFVFFFPDTRTAGGETCSCAFFSRGEHTAQTLRSAGAVVLWVGIYMRY
jgi:hypothetical protein